MKNKLHTLITASVTLCAATCLAQESTFRFYQGVAAYVNNPDGKAFEIAVDVRDWNLMENGPREVLLKIYAPDGKVLERKVVPDDGVTGHMYLPETGGWDHEMWYYLLNYGRGSVPMIRWSSLTEPSRVAALPKRTFTFPIPGGTKGIYRVLLAGSRDHVVTLRLKPELKYALAGHPLWMHGHGAMFKRSYIYVPKGAIGLNLAFAEYDQPVTRTFTLTAPDGTKLYTGSANGGYAKFAMNFEPPSKYDDQLLTMDVSDGSGDYMMQVLLQRDDYHPYRQVGGAPAFFAPDKETATALRGGAIYHDGQVFWHGYQVRLYEWLKKLKPEDFVIKDANGNEIKPTEGTRIFGRSAPWLEYKGLPEAPGFVPLNGVHEPPPLSDRLMHNYAAHKDPHMLNVALRDLAEGLRIISVGDVPLMTHGNLGYLFATYGWHFWRPAWRVLQLSDAPQEVKDIVREAMILCGDRLAFARGIERSNGNAMAHIPMALRYCAEGTKDPIQIELAATYLERFTNGGWGKGVGISKSGDCQEHFAHDYHYGSYIGASYKAIVHDLGDPKFKAILDKHNALYGYLYCADANAYPWDSRTYHEAPLEIADVKSKPGPDFTVSVHDGNEWFAARRKNYYILTFHGHLAPEWLDNYFASRLGYGGGILCQLTVPGKGTVLASTLADSYGKGMERANWPNFHIHSLVGTLADGTPFVAADSEHLNAKLTDKTVTGSGEVRDRPLRVTRSYTFGDDRIACSLQLADTGYREAYFNMGPPSAIAEAYEMIPFLSPKDKPATVKGPGGEAITEQSVSLPGVVIDRGGYGVKIEFDQARPVKLGKSDTVLVQLAKQPTTPDKVGFKYSLIPFVAAP